MLLKGSSGFSCVNSVRSRFYILTNNSGQSGGYLITEYDLNTLKVIRFHTLPENCVKNEELKGLVISSDD